MCEMITYSHRQPFPRALITRSELFLSAKQVGFIRVKFMHLANAWLKLHQKLKVHSVSNAEKIIIKSNQSK